ncbi:hypothetical protein AAFF_G00074620 [Aldrovandia affinis]|uniref:Uncharacterized protein n=1 Tax=Aldrovandia affinis TaxID=143900 RepID=A0AAD7RYD5_9TELE|nr:hypothetical protein AAFF_G00074620 [Aldrovandia affinis]
MPMAPRSTVKRSPVKDTSRKVNVGPFTSPEDFALGMIRVKDNEDSKEGFMIITFKKRQSHSGKYLSPRRLKWSRELERVPTLDTLSKGNSQAQVGGALSYTNTSQWYSSSTENTHDMLVSAFTDEEDGHFSLSESAGKLVGQQLQRGNVVRVGTNGNYKSSGESPERDKPIQAHSPATISISPSAVQAFTLSVPERLFIKPQGKEEAEKARSTPPSSASLSPGRKSA